MPDPQLMEDFFLILEQCQDPDEIFKGSPMEKDFATGWLLKLCNEIYGRNEEKQLRNLYLLELSKCIRDGKLKKLFRSLPPKGKLQPFESSFKIEIDPKTIIDEMQASAAELYPHVSPKNYQTHMSTKIFDDNRGACAYLALSLGDPNEGSTWMHMGSKEPFNQTDIKREYIEECDCCHFDEDDDYEVDSLFTCLNEVAKELSGHAEPGESPILEEKLALYENFIKKYDIGNEAKQLNETELRTFLLINYQTDLLRVLQRCQ